MQSAWRDEEERVNQTQPATMQSAWRDEEERVNQTQPATMQSAWRDEEERAIPLISPVTDILLPCRHSVSQVR